MRETYIRFMAPIMPQSADSLLRIIDKKINEKIDRIHLMISSPGGSVYHGLAIYNFLKGAPVEIYTYNFATVDSIGVVMFCAGDKRYSVPHARFLIHGVQINFQGNQSLDEKGLEEKLSGLKMDYQNIARVISATTRKKPETVENDMNNRITLDPNQAKDYGLVDIIKSELFPSGADINFVYEQGQNIQMQPQIIPQQGIPMRVPQIRHLSKPEVESFTRSENIDVGTNF